MLDLNIIVVNVVDSLITKDRYVGKWEFPNVVFTDEPSDAKLYTRSRAEHIHRLLIDLYGKDGLVATIVELDEKKPLVKKSGLDRFHNTPEYDLASLVAFMDNKPCGFTPYESMLLSSPYQYHVCKTHTGSLKVAVSIPGSPPTLTDSYMKTIDGFGFSSVASEVIGYGTSLFTRLIFTE